MNTALLSVTIGGRTRRFCGNRFHNRITRSFSIKNYKWSAYINFYVQLSRSQWQTPIINEGKVGSNQHIFSGTDTKNVTKWKECSRGYFLFPMAQQPVVGHDLLIIEASQWHWHTTLDRTHLDKWSARHTDTTHNTHKRQTSMSPTGFEPTIQASERPQTHALDRTATKIGRRVTAQEKYVITDQQQLYTVMPFVSTAEFIKQPVCLQEGTFLSGLRIWTSPPLFPDHLLAHLGQSGKLNPEIKTPEGEISKSVYIQC